MSYYDEYEVHTSKGSTFHSWSKDRCKNLGRGRFQCGSCRLGYFNVFNEREYDRECPECKAEVWVTKHTKNFWGL